MPCVSVVGRELGVFVRVALFDLDGTLVDSLADLALALNRTRAEFDLPPITIEEVRACVGEGVRMLVKRAFPEKPGSIEELLERQRANYCECLLENTVLYPGVRETLEQLKSAGWALGIVTNKPSAMTWPIIEGVGIRHLFSAVVGGGDSSELKPHPSPLFLAASRMGKELDAEDWIVGDHFTDLAAGRQAGIKRAFCTFGFGEARDESFDVALDHMERLLEVLELR